MLGEHLSFLFSSNIIAPVSLRPRLQYAQSTLIGQLTHTWASIAVRVTTQICIDFDFPFRIYQE